MIICCFKDTGGKNMIYNYKYELDSQENLDNKKIEILTLTFEQKKVGLLNGIIKYDNRNRQYYFMLDNIYVYTAHQKQGCGTQMIKLLKEVLNEVEKKYNTKIWWITGYLGNKGCTYPDWDISLPFLEKCSKIIFGNYGFELYNSVGNIIFESAEDFLNKAIAGHFVIKLADYPKKKYQFYEVSF